MDDIKTLIVENNSSNIKYIVVFNTKYVIFGIQ